MLNEMNIPLEEDGIEEEILVDEEVAVTKAMWGDIGGNIENQTDLQNALDAKQDSLTEAQLNAVNSGITSDKVTAYDGYSDQIASKADQSALNAEATTREQADTALGTRIDNEALARQNADNGLQSQIDAITSKSDVVDVVANYEALQAYDTRTLGNNDVIKVLDDETHEDALTYYRWSTTTQTWSYIGQEAPYYSKGQMDVKLAEKQDKLTAGANIQIQNGTISATDTTYTAGNGLNLNGTEFSANTNILATKEDLDGYYTKSETDNLLAPKLEAEVVAELPSTGTEGKLYLAPKAHTTQTATGNPITATVAEDTGALESFQLDGDTEQQTYTGINKFDVEQYINAILRTQGDAVSLTKIDDTTLRATNKIKQGYNFCGIPIPNGMELLGKECTASGKATLSGVALTRVAFAWNNSGVSVFGTPLDISQDGAFSYTATIPSTAPSSATGLMLVVYANGNNNTGDVGSYVDWSELQLEVGSAATSYEPYVGGIASPNPDYPQPIQTVTGTQTVEIVGKNLFDRNNASADNLYTTNQGVVVRSTNAFSVQIAIEPNTTYTISRGDGGTDGSVSCFDAVPTERLSATARATFGGNPSATVTTGSNSRYLLVYLGWAMSEEAKTAALASLQIEKGSTATAFAPYSKQTLPLDLGSIELCKLGTYQDYIWKDGEDWKVHKATSSTVFDGSSDEEWTRYTGGGGAYWGFYILKADTISGSPSVANILRNVPDSAPWAGGKYTYRVSSILNLCFALVAANDTLMSLAEWRTYLGTNNLIVKLALATPTDTVITDTTLIAQLEAIRTAMLQNGANTITNTTTGSNLAGDMEIGYYGFAPRNRYDKFIWLDINNEYEQIGS